jgi:hypothetical protein
MHVKSLRGVLIASFLTPCPALAATPNESACIIKVAEAVPKIAGMRIGKSKTTDQPAPPNWPSPHPPVRVEIDWSAAGQSQKWFYLCAVNASGTAVVQRLAN